MTILARFNNTIIMAAEVVDGLIGEALDATEDEYRAYWTPLPAETCTRLIELASFQAPAFDGNWKFRGHTSAISFDLRTFQRRTSGEVLRGTMSTWRDGTRIDATIGMDPGARIMLGILIPVMMLVLIGLLIAVVPGIGSSSDRKFVPPILVSACLVLLGIGGLVAINRRRQRLFAFFAEELDAVPISAL
jgi:hypothetical protein